MCPRGPQEHPKDAKIAILGPTWPNLAPTWRPKTLQNRCKKRDVFYHRFFGALASIWKPFDLQVGAKLLSWTPKTLPKAFKIQVFWEHVSKMLPKRLQSGSKRGPKEGPEVDLGRIFDWFGSLFSYFWLSKFILSTKTAGIIFTCWVTPSLEKYKL